MILVVVSTGHFDPLIKECERLKHNYDFMAQIGTGDFIPTFPYYRTTSPTQLQTDMERAEVIISHGGTGMLSMLYRLKKKAVIVPKQKRYGEANDMQVALAKKWDELGMGILCMDVEKLSSAIQKAKVTEPFYPYFPSLGQHLRNSLPSGTPIPVGA